MSVNTRNVLNDWDVTCTLVADGPEHFNYTYRLRYRTYPPLRFEDGAVDLGEVARAGTDSHGSCPSTSSWLERYEPADHLPDFPLKIQTTRPLAAELVHERSSELLENGRVRRSRRRLRITLDPEALSGDGLFSGAITASTEGGTAVSTIATWRITSPIVATPSNLSFGLIKSPQGVATRKVVLTSRDGRPFRVLGVTSDEGVTTHKNAPVGGDSAKAVHVIELLYRRPEATRRFVAGRTSFATDNPEMPTVSVMWSVITS
jgi:hypothetical protein